MPSSCSVGRGFGGGDKKDVDGDDDRMEKENERRDGEDDGDNCERNVGICQTDYILTPIIRRSSFISRHSFHARVDQDSDFWSLARNKKITRHVQSVHNKE